MAENESQQDEQKGGRSGFTKAVIALLAILLLEGGIIGVTIYIAGGPRAARGDQSQEGSDDQDRPVEVLVVDDKFPNLKTGRQYLYDTEVYITVRSSQSDTIKKKLESMKAQVQMAIGGIIRQADPSYFKEPTLTTLRRQIRSELDERFGKDSEDRSFILEVLITKCIPFRSGF